MNKIKSISILGFSIVILLCCTLPGFALAENTLQNNQIAVLYLYTKSSFDFHTFSKGEADVNGALDEGLLFTEWLKNKDFEPFKFGDEISGTIGIDEQIKMSNDILNHKYNYKVLEHDFGNDEFGDPINDKMVEFKLPEKVGRSFQVMTEIFLKINNAWNGFNNVDYTGDYMLVNSVNKAKQTNPVIMYTSFKDVYATVGAVRQSTFKYGDEFEYYDADGVLNRLGNWFIEYGIVENNNSNFNGEKYVKKVTFKHKKFIDNEWVDFKEYIPYENTRDPKKEFKYLHHFGFSYEDSDIFAISNLVYELDEHYDFEKALFYRTSYVFFFGSRDEKVCLVQCAVMGMVLNSATYYEPYPLNYVPGSSGYYRKRVLHSDDLDELVLFRKIDSYTFNSGIKINGVRPYSSGSFNFIPSWQENILGTDEQKNGLNKLHPTFEGSVRERWQTGEADFSKPYVDNFLPSRGWDYWALCGLLIEDFKNGYKNYYYLITFPVEGINEDGTMNLRNSFSTYEHIKETAPNDSILRNEAVGSGKYEDVKDNLPNDKNSIDFISYHINNLLSLPGLNSIVIFGLSFGLAVFVIGRRGF